MCPICRQSGEKENQYGDTVCGGCQRMATDEKGKKLVFFQATTAGFDYRSYCKTGNRVEAFRTIECYVKGIRCQVRAMHNGRPLIRPLSAL